VHFKTGATFMIFIVLLQALWASSIPMGKVLVSMCSPIFLTGIRMFIAGVLLLGYKYWFTQERFSMQQRHLWYYAQIIFFGIYVKYILRYWGLAHMPSSKMAFLVNVSPFCVALFSYIAFRERLSIKKWMGLVLGFLGIVPILITTSAAEKLVGEFFFFSWAEIAILTEVAAHSYALVVMRMMVRDNGYSSGMANGIRMFGGGVLALLTSLAVETGAPVHATNINSFIIWLTILIIVSNIVCHNLYIYLLKYYSATFLSLTDFLSPLFVALYGSFFLQETITWHYGISAFIVLCGMYLFYQEELQTEQLFRSELSLQSLYATVKQKLSFNRST
jgi:drug/metabolite transporter (DMT)-like permease